MRENDCLLCSRNAFTRVEHVFASQIKLRFSNAKLYVMGSFGVVSQTRFISDEINFMILNSTQWNALRAGFQVQNIK